MKFNLFKKCVLASSIAALACPVASLVASCAPTETRRIQSISLSLKPNYICPGQSVAIRKSIYPYVARNNPLNWEIVDCPYDGFTISDSGVLTAPRDITINDPMIMHVKASDVEDSEIHDELAIAIINQPEEDKPFIGFAENKITYKDVDGQDATMKIVQTNSPNTYETEKPINLFGGRPFENIEFVPIVGKGRNDKMKFHLHGEDPESLRALSWVGYSDNTWVDEIPTFSVSFVQDLYDVIEVHFACDDTLVLRINFNVFQGPKQYTDACMAYFRPSSDKPYHYIEAIDDYNGIFDAPIQLPLTPGTGKKTDVMREVYVYRKPYEYLDDLTFSFEYPLADKGITEDWIKAEVINPRIETWREYDNYQTYIMNIQFTIDWSKFNAADWHYDAINVINFVVRDEKHDHGCYCTFHAQWVDEQTESEVA